MTDNRLKIELIKLLNAEAEITHIRLELVICKELKIPVGFASDEIQSLVKSGFIVKNKNSDSYSLDNI